MNIDFHCHVLLSKKAVFNNTLFDKTINQSKKMGLTSVVMTEHIHAKYFEQIFDYLDLYYTYKGIYYDVGGFRLYTGMEVDLDNRGHILVVAHKTDILKLRRKLINKYPDNPSLEQLLAEAKVYDTFMIGAHPLREDRLLTGIDENTLRQLDALDINGEDIHLRAEVERLAAELNLPVVGGSDAHLYIQAGVVQTCFEQPFESISQLKQMLLVSQPRITSHPFIRLKVKLAGYVTRRIKKRILAKQVSI